MPEAMYGTLHAHLFPGDGDEHGAVIEAGIVQTSRGTKLLARTVIFPKKGTDWVPGNRGYRMITASFVRKRIRECRDERLIYLAVHNHGGNDSVAFSKIDLETHERGFPALLDVANGMAVGGLVFARNAVAGDIWLDKTTRLTLDRMVVVGTNRNVLTPERENLSATAHADPQYDRQSRMFGDRGQKVLESSRIAIIGCGGVGMLLAEYLGRLGVKNVILVDPDRVEITNLPRLPGARGFDAMSWLTRTNRPAWLQDLGRKFSTRKVDLANRSIRKANGKAQVTRLFNRFEEKRVTDEVNDCDYIFLAADTHRARLLLNAVCHQYLIPGVQMGTNIPSDRETGEVGNIHTRVRTVLPDLGCLKCNEAISAARLQEESTPEGLKRQQRYTDDEGVTAPSVITLNALSASQAANDFLFHMTGLFEPKTSAVYLTGLPRLRKFKSAMPRRDMHCSDCGFDQSSRRARGDNAYLPLVD